MAKYRLKLKELRRILASFGVDAIDSQGKGSHVKFVKVIRGSSFSYPVPNRKDVLPCYVKGCRRKFELTEEDGVTGEDFFGRA